MDQLSSALAFKMAIEAGFLSNDQSKKNFAGAFMYMGIAEGSIPKMQFKHINLRSYVIIPFELV